MFGPQKIDIVLRENSDFEWEFRLETSACSVIGIDDYGFTFQVRHKEEGALLLSATHSNYISINTTTDIATIDIPHTVIAAAKESFRTYGLRGVYDLIAYPGAGTPTADPIALAYGRVTYQLGVTELS